MLCTVNKGSNNIKIYDTLELGQHTDEILLEYRNNQMRRRGAE
jgi:hypothetical protein